MSFRKTSQILLVLSIAFGNLINPFIVRAHEVYVLDPTSVAKDLTLPPLNLFQIALSHEYLFLLSAFLGILGLVCIFGISLSRKLEKLLDPIIFKIKPYAGYITQVTLGLALGASAYYGVLFGTELSFIHVFGQYTQLATAGLIVASASLIFGIYPRLGGFIGMVIYLFSLKTIGMYMVSYLTYFGEALVTFFFGGGYAIITYGGKLFGSGNLMFEIQKRKHFLIRIFFSSSLIYTAFYAKFIHGALALDTVNTYHLTHYFPFDQPFIVLGAFLVEITIALFYLIGFEIRFTSLFFLTFLSMSLVFFGESVWPHIILIGTALAMFVHGYDEYTIEHTWYLKNKREPVL